MFAKLNFSRTGGFLVELLMLVLGINIALWFEGQFQEYQDAKAEEAYLVGLRRDVLEDASSLERLANVNESRAGRLAGILDAMGTLGDMPDEEVVSMMFEVSTYDFFVPEDFTYRAMQESGDFSLLSDPDLKEALLRQHRRYKLIGTLEDNFLQALDDEYIPLLIRSVDLAAGRLVDRDIGESVLARNMVAFTINETQARTLQYRLAHEKALELVGLIDSRLGH